MIVMMAHSVLAGPNLRRNWAVYSGRLGRARSPDRRHRYAVDAHGARLVPAALQVHHRQQLQARTVLHVECVSSLEVRQRTRSTSRHCKCAKLSYPLVPIHHEDGHVRPLGVVAATHLHLQVP